MDKMDNKNIEASEPIPTWAMLGLWETTEAEQEEIDDILADLGLDDQSLIVYFIDGGSWNGK